MKNLFKVFVVMSIILTAIACKPKTECKDEKKCDSTEMSKCDSTQVDAVTDTTLVK